jgi:hypothetical protein
MSAERSLETYTVPMLRGAIAQLEASGMWWSRLRQLRSELRKRQYQKLKP